MANYQSDAEWIKTSFMLPKVAGNILADRKLLQGNAALKFTDTTLGGNFAINPPPQFTEFADLRVKSRFSASEGMGRKYSEMIDDNSQLVHLRFGVPEYNSLTTFFTGFYDTAAGTLSRTGRAPGFFYRLGQVAGFVVTLPLAPLILAGSIYRFLANKPASKFYYMKPTMPLYWNAVNSIANGIAVNMGMVPRVFSTDTNTSVNGEKTMKNVESYNDSQYFKDQPNYGKEDVALYHKILPSLFQEGGGIDIYAVANRAQRLADASHRRAIEWAEDVASPAELKLNMQEFINEDIEDDKQAMRSLGGGNSGLAAYMHAWENVPAASQPVGSGDDDASTGAEIAGDRSWFSKAESFFDAETRDGSQFVTFRVNHTGTASESFSNSFGESDLARSINGISADSRSKTFNFAGGNFVDLPVIGDVLGAIGGFASGALDAIGMSGLVAMGGRAFVDIPEKWESATANLPTASYEMELRSPYGNKMSRFMNLWVPISMLLAGGLPKSTGKHSYDSPFLCQLFDKGRAQIRLGMIDSISITRGVGNLGWTKDHEALGVNVSFSVKDLSTVLHMPINASPGLFDEDNAYTDYLAVLGSLSMADQIYVSRRLQLNLTRQMVDFKKWTSPAFWGNWAGGTLAGQTISAFARVTDRPD